MSDVGPLDVRAESRTVNVALNVMSGDVAANSLCWGLPGPISVLIPITSVAAGPIVEYRTDNCASLNLFHASA
jgi:hypothetical protein